MVELKDEELQAVAYAVDYFLYMRGKAKRQSQEVRIRHARLILISERLQVALDAKDKEVGLRKLGSGPAKLASEVQTHA